MKRFRLYPPVGLLCSIIVMVFLDDRFPEPEWVESTWRAVGWLPIGVAVVLIVGVNRQFRHRGTTIKPFEESSALVTEGLFRFSRNPIYLSMVGLLLGVAVLLRSVAPLVVIPLFALWIEFRFIRGEERLLAARFGEAYLDYRRRVRRWL